MVPPAVVNIPHWLLAIRPKTLPAAMGPVAVGSAMAFADGGFALWPALGCLAGAMLLQIGVNLANDYFDFKNKIDSAERLGPVRVTQSGLISPGAVRLAMVVTLALAALIFCALAIVGGWPILLVCLASVAAALAYSGGPYPLASHGLGELFVFIFFGLVAVGGTYLVQVGSLRGMVLVTAVPPGLLITAIMVVNNLRDIDTDQKAGKNTLAVKLGRRWTVRHYRLLLLVAYLVPLTMVVAGSVGSGVLLPLVTLPLAWSLGRRMNTQQGAALNSLLGTTAMLSLFYSLLFSLGLVYGIR